MTVWLASVVDFIFLCCTVLTSSLHNPDIIAKCLFINHYLLLMIWIKHIFVSAFTMKSVCESMSRYVWGMCGVCVCVCRCVCVCVDGVFHETVNWILLHLKVWHTHWFIHMQCTLIINVFILLLTISISELFLFKEIQILAIVCYCYSHITCILENSNLNIMVLLIAQR